MNPLTRYSIKVTTDTMVTYFSLSSMSSVIDFIESNPIEKAKIEISKL